MSKTRSIRWDKLDNTANLFPSIAGESMTNVYRISVTLTDEIDSEKLQEALDIVLPKFGLFNVRLRMGVFWNYFEENGGEVPQYQGGAPRYAGRPAGRPGRGGNRI